jgi:hypothetical protein
MAKYTNISAEEMDAFLTAQGFKRVVVPGTYEAVFGKRVDKGGHQLTLRVFTGIVGDDSRGVGEDAIRVSLWIRKGGEVFKLNGSKRVHRVVNWKANLQSRIDGWEEHLKICPKCGMPMMLKKGKNGPFLGCTGYRDGCRHTENMEKKK